MVKRRNMKKGKRKGGGWKDVRDMYDPIHKEILSEPELEEPPSVKNVSVPHRKSPRSRIPRNTQTIKGKHWSRRPVDGLTLSNINDGDTDTDSEVEPNPDEVVIVEETKRDKEPADWATASPGSLHKLLRGRNKGGGSRRKYKLSKKKQKRKYTKRRKSSKRKSGKRKSSRRKYTKRR